MLSEREKLNVLTRLGIELNQVQDLDILMERILTEARRFVNADAGSIYIKDGDILHFTYTQNDTLQKRLNKGEKLIYSFFTIPMDMTSMAGYVACTGEVLNIPNVYKIDAAKPYGFSRLFDQASEYTTRSALTIPLKTAKEEMLGVLQIINARNVNNRFVAFSKKDQAMMRHFASIAAVALKRARMTRVMIFRMIRMAEMRDPEETGEHINRVGSYALEIYEKWAHKHHVSQDEIDKNRDVFRMAAMLHDVGKIAIPDSILKKPGLFSEDEYDAMKKHTIYGAQLFQDRQSEFDDAAAEVALNHHEWWNGCGYPGHVDIATGSACKGYTCRSGKPRGKKGEEIPIFGRIVSLVDVYDALCSTRIYKGAWDESKVLGTIEQASGVQFDPELVEIFFDSLDIIRSVQNRYKGV